jgi:hypothetical protein
MAAYVCGLTSSVARQADRQTDRGGLLSGASDEMSFVSLDAGRVSRQAGKVVVVVLLCFACLTQGGPQQQDRARQDSARLSIYVCAPMDSQRGAVLCAAG